MDFTISTPAILFPAISLIVLAYTNRFMAISTLIRTLHDRYRSNERELLLKRSLNERRQLSTDLPPLKEHERRKEKELLLGQMKNLRMRLRLIRDMQILGITAIFICTFSIFMIMLELRDVGRWMFVLSVMCLLFSLALSLWEIVVSTHALSIELSDIEDEESHFFLLPALSRFRKRREEERKTADDAGKMPGSPL